MYTDPDRARVRLTTPLKKLVSLRALSFSAKLSSGFREEGENVKSLRQHRQRRRQTTDKL